ncbi:Nucleolar complex protein 2-like protein [Hibiscus syriacus]|uniref:Nucleolar complex protein 2-like protein n=1 Tax=Hibiscus syriacus TaxID=106335 RepID=A0A6A3CSZ2_HIBSY|nr:Nucleolar complex protein 2-like protein [Hibiscus syriacus]
MSKSQSAAKQHKGQLERLQKKDPEFYQYLQEHGKDLLTFDDEDIDDDAEDVDIDMEDEETQLDDETDIPDEEKKPSKNVLTTEMVNSWCKSIREDEKLSAVHSLMKAFRTACHYGDDTGNDSSAKFTTMSSSVFNKIMLFTLSEMDRVLRKLLKLPSSGGKRETITELMNTKQWKNYNHLVKSYLGNALHVLNQMTDMTMISFTLRRLQYSSVFLSAFPSLLRKYIKVALHFWGTGGDALPGVSFLFLRDLCIRLGSDCLDECFRDIYKAYVLNCHFVNAAKLQHIQFLANCIIELIRVDLPTAYQHAFVFIRQLAMLLRDALNMKTKEAFRKVYEWKFINCLELWTGAICTFSTEADFRPLAYPLTQIIYGVARLVPTARYFPLRLRCVRMLNRISASTGTFIPVSMLLLDMLEMKELSRPPTGGVGKAIEANVEFTNERRASVTFLPNDSAATSFLEDEKKTGTSPLSQYVITLRQRAHQRNDSMMESSVVVGENSSVFGRKLDQIPDSDEEDDTRNEDGASVFSSSWLPGGNSSSDEDEGEDGDGDVSESDTSFGEDGKGEHVGGSSRQRNKKQKPKNLSNKNVRSRHHAKNNKSKKRKRAA